VHSSASVSTFQIISTKKNELPDPYSFFFVYEVMILKIYLLEKSSLNQTHHDEHKKKEKEKGTARKYKAKHRD
jgi:hypothetical protein